MTSNTHICYTSFHNPAPVLLLLPQAPSNMKSVLQAGWLFTVAVGNIIVLIISEAATLEDQVGGRREEEATSERMDPNLY